MCGEEQHRVTTLLFRELSEGRLDVLRDGLVGRERRVGNTTKENGRAVTHLNETAMCAPSVNDTPVDAREKPGPAFSVDVVETAARRAAAILGVLRKGYRAFYAVLLHAPCGLFCERSCVAKRDIALVRRCGWMELVEQCCHALPLKFRPAQNRGAAANLLILLLDLRSPSFGNPWCYDRLKRERDEVPVQEEVSEEVVGFGDL